MIKEFTVSGYIDLDDYVGDIHLFNEIRDASADDTYYKYDKALSSLGNELEKIMSDIGIASWNVDYEHWEKGDYYYIDSVFLRIFFAKKKTTWDKINKEHVIALAGGMRVEENFDGYSEYTITDNWHEIFVGKHDIVEILRQNLGKYMIMKLSVKVRD